MEPNVPAYFMPAEWEMHAATLLSWPHLSTTWVDEYRLRKVEAVYVKIISALANSEPVVLLVSDEKTEERAKVSLASTFTVFPIVFVRIPNNDTWARDYGPIVVRDGSGKWVFQNWGFNSWGGKYPPFDADNAVPHALANRFHMPVADMPLILEGGSIDVNGKGVLLTTESVLLTPTRNPQYSKDQIADILKQNMGLTDIVWLGRGMEGDDTDGHIDDLSRFVDEKTVVTLVTEDKNSPNYHVLKENEAALRDFVCRDGSRFTVIPVPMPNTTVSEPLRDGTTTAPASYANFLITNKSVLLPVYDPRFDDGVVALFQKLFPTRTVVSIPCADLVWGQGSIHCITQQLYGVRV
jgi:agmatine deiminase